jgi:hypothetical protein
LALLAAYAIALQAVLLPLTVMAGAADAQGLCATSSGGEQSAPTDRDAGCGCAAGCGMQCCAPALTGPPQGGAVIYIAELAGPVAQSTGYQRQTILPHKGPHNPRAPPLA